MKHGFGGGLAMGMIGTILGMALSAGWFLIGTIFGYSIGSELKKGERETPRE